MNEAISQSDLSYFIDMLEMCNHSFKIEPSLNCLKCLNCDLDFNEYKISKKAYFEMQTKCRNTKFELHFLQSNLIKECDVDNCLFSAPYIGLNKIDQDYNFFVIKFTEYDLFKNSNFFLIFVE